MRFNYFIYYATLVYNLNNDPESVTVKFYLCYCVPKEPSRKKLKFTGSVSVEEAGFPLSPFAVGDLLLYHNICRYSPYFGVIKSY